jgi:hypothetical protein
MDGPADLGKTTVAHAGDGVIYFAVGDVAEVRAVDTRGAVTALARWSHEPTPVTREIEEAALQRRVDVMPPSLRDATREHWWTLIRPSHLPVLDGLLVAANGQVWVRRYSEDPAEERLWWVFSANLALLGTAVVPEGLNVMAIGDGELFVVSRDSLGVEYVEVRPLELAPDGH